MNQKDESLKVTCHQQNVICKLKTELSEQKQVIRRYRNIENRQKNMIISLKQKIKDLKLANELKNNIETSEKSVQYNTMRSIIKNLKDEIESLESEIDIADEIITLIHRVRNLQFLTQSHQGGVWHTMLN